MATMPAGLLEVLRCPVTGSPLTQDGDELVSTASDASGKPVRYRLEEGIPVMLRAGFDGAEASGPAADH